MVRATDVVSDTDVRTIVEKIRNNYYQARRAFRDHDATNIDSNSFDFPVSDNDLDGEVVEIGENSNYPRSNLSWSEVSAAYTKYGVELTISDEAVDDGYIDVAMEAQDDMVRAEERRMEAVAYGVLDGNTNSTVGDIDANSNNNDTMEEADIEKARQEYFNAELDLNDAILLASGDNMSDFLNMSGFTQASELGDFVMRRGILPEGDLANQAFLGVVHDIPVYLSNTGAFTEGDAFLVDTGAFGWESTRWDTEVTSYYEDDQDQTVYKIRGRADWVATQPDANIKIST
jgi:hypothetical protein